METADDVPDFSQLPFPVELKDITKFENLNDISVNVYGIEERVDHEDDEDDLTQTPSAAVNASDDSDDEKGIFLQV